MMWRKTNGCSFRELGVYFRRFLFGADTLVPRNAKETSVLSQEYTGDRKSYSIS